MRLSRRAILTAGAATAAGLAAPALARGGARPNVLLITVDELSWGALAAHGALGVATPNLDGLIARGVSFNRSYCSDPACSPSRASWLTGREAIEHGVLLNGLPQRPGLPEVGGWLREQGGYDTFHIGKWHVLPREAALGFTVLHEGNQIGEQGDIATAQSAVAFLNNRRGRTPFFLSVNFLNPHDICAWLRFPHPTQEWAALSLDPAELPALPPSFATPAREPALLRLRKRSSARAWTEPVWRLYLWTYMRQVEMMDGAVGRVLDALALSRFSNNTLLLFTSDHGELLGEHRLLGKSAPYEGAMRVPLVAAWPGRIGPGIDATRLVSGVDLFPTLCDYAGVAPPPALSGRSLRPILEGQPIQWRANLGASCTVDGRIFYEDRYKYVSYRGDDVDLLFDLEADPQELNDLSERPEHAPLREHLRAGLARWEAALDADPTASSDFATLAARLATPQEDGDDPL